MVNYHHHILHVGHLGNFLQVPQVDHVHIIAHVFILYSSGANAIGAEEGRKL